MSEYNHSLNVNASPDDVFDFVSDIGNLPQYLPTVSNATPQSGERIRVQGEAGGHRYDSDGFFRLNEDERRMEWGSDGENNYRGSLEVKPGSDAKTSEVSVRLSFEPRPELAERMERQAGDRGRAIQEGIEKALLSIKNLCEGRGGKVESSAATHKK
jgi:hypothetical protein